MEPALSIDSMAMPDETPGRMPVFARLRRPGEPLPARGRLASAANPPQSVRTSARESRVFLVGAGPGEPDLLTLRAARLLASADVIVYDQLVDQGVLDLARPEARRVYVGKQAGHHSMPQDAINALLVALARDGLQVVRLKGGDPFIFGRGGEEVEALFAAGIGFEIVPGITAASGMAAYAGIPLTHRDHAQSCVFVTGHLKDGSTNLDWAALARPRQTLVIYMGVGALDEICRELMAHGMPANLPAALVHRATLPEQRTVAGTLATLPRLALEHDIRAPALIVIGEVVSLHRRFDWFEKRSRVLPALAS